MTIMADKIYDLVKTRRHVSFAELERLIPGFCYGDGEGKKTTAFALSEHPQLIVWLNISDEGVAALEELRKSQRVSLNQCSHLVYMADGKMLPFPIPKRMPRPGTKKDYWMPCVLDTEPIKQTRRGKQ